jgi:hypothetical protein
VGVCLGIRKWKGKNAYAVEQWNMAAILCVTVQAGATAVLRQSAATFE